MAKKKSESAKALDRAAKLIQTQLNTLPSEVAAQKVKELAEMAAKAYRSAKSGTGRRAQRTEAIHLSRRSHAKIA